MIDIYCALILGNPAALAIAEGIEDETIEIELFERIKKLLSFAVNDETRRFWKSVARARDKLHFLLDEKLVGTPD